ncbi:GNAT family N-acetyltransferase [Sulfitobacter mediterraneus]|uniref:GNAT family N-acetyltransferase n=1 Tax=Sulfitobacter mediterraneus TaxID=83219 RepID=UPI001934213E|nr:GNAT family N-acetyltransferase [Sulfitobacter mediterraneus]MBM1632365.1 GNAT family N-acetyltransferase [Sulfitobacter mediterraneus]MBM1640182.1 GNAT family N-acetyltransferase [Sulfitobacter mediterraneus]MBM1644230.1 GNAT family N-acetyltransferase [Sulfitobacter mediterraneus]MBM1648277.1 GNAT family N-acetyltransferase [Sulfitobacter mediterraneus]MBM1652322.1 GNAT family N-acetyltransferase [Sulfitobacter mediterraneus]
MTLTITPTRADDIPALRQILDQTELFPPEMLKEMLMPALDGSHPALWLTAHLDGSAIGFSYTEPEMLAEGAWNMLAIAIAPDHQGKGHGADLVRATEAQLRQNAQRLLIVETSGLAAYAATRRFYDTAGYDQEARIRDFWADGDDKVIFRKRL